MSSSWDGVRVEETGILYGAGYWAGDGNSPREGHEAGRRGPSPCWRMEAHGFHVLEPRMMKMNKPHDMTTSTSDAYTGKSDGKGCDEHTPKANHKNNDPKKRHGTEATKHAKQKCLPLVHWRTQGWILTLPPL
ncbi:hypothetical protein Sjap_011221 [Stephania japonica]|uniref:Uncharacterized protein n=1 Tax=Stephania japonica TaxID=461633 RepID=A0AAP0P5C6_9MAGN